MKITYRPFVLSVYPCQRAADSSASYASG